MGTLSSKAVPPLYIKTSIVARIEVCLQSSDADTQICKGLHVKAFGLYAVVGDGKCLPLSKSILTLHLNQVHYLAQ